MARSAIRQLTSALLTHCIGIKTELLGIGSGIATSVTDHCVIGMDTTYYYANGH